MLHPLRNRFSFTGGCSTQLVSMFNPSRYVSSSARKLAAIFNGPIDQFDRQSEPVKTKNRRRRASFLFFFRSVSACAAATYWTHRAVF